MTTETVTHKYNLSSNMSHRINFDQMVECRLAEVQAAYGDEVGDWHLYFDLDELDVDDEAEAAARIESIWPVLARPGDFGIIVWIGPGWYAPRSIRNDIWYYCCGDNRDQEPDTYTKGLGSPDWYDEPPVWMETR